MVLRRAPKCARRTPISNPPARSSASCDWRLDLEVEQARLDLKAADERLEVSGKAVEQAEESAGLTRNRFEQGLALSTQLIDSESALVAARVRRAEAEADRRIAIAALRKALALPQLDSQPARN